MKGIQVKSVKNVLTGIIMSIVMALTLPFNVIRSDAADEWYVGEYKYYYIVHDHIVQNNNAVAPTYNLTVNITSGSLPPGVTITPSFSTRTISGGGSGYTAAGGYVHITTILVKIEGTPTATGTYTFSWQLTDSGTTNMDFGTETITVVNAAAKTTATAAEDAAYTEAQRAYAAYHDHAHNGNFDRFTWTTISDATDYADGLEVYRCPDCGYVLYEVPVSAYSNFNKSYASQINGASHGATVTINAGQWISFHKMVTDAWMARPDVTVVINYTYDHIPYQLTIPAGTDLSGLLHDDESFIGFLAIAARTGLTPVVR